MTEKSVPIDYTTQEQTALWNYLQALNDSTNSAAQTTNQNFQNILTQISNLQNQINKLNAQITAQAKPSSPIVAKMFEPELNP